MRILVVDDSFDNARLFAMLLELLGHETQFVTDVASAMEMLPSFRPDVVFSDISMDHVDGFGLAERIRSDGASRDVVLVVHSGHSEPAVRERAMAVGYDFYLVKPAEPSELTPLLAQIAALKGKR